MSEEHPVTIDIQSIEVLSYALAHNRIPVIGQISLSGVSAPVRGATVRVTISDAQGQLSQPFETAADLEPGELTVLRDLPVRLDPGQMAQVEEQRPGTIEVEVLDGDQELGRVQAPVRILAANQWLRNGTAVTDEILASFAMPNHPATEQVLSEASAVLAEQTSSPSIDGYQGGDRRVDEIVEALFVAAQRRQIRYAEPPASWSDIGQKVRNPGEVFDGPIGTCLDITLALAAVLEQAGIRPLIFLVEGHAFLGYWRIEASLQVTLQTDAAAVINLIDLKAIALIETTMITAGPDQATFEAAQRSPYAQYLTGDAEQVMGVIDVYEARQNMIIPLPARIRTADDSVQVIEYRPAMSQPPVRPDRAEERSSRAGVDRTPVPPRVRNWKNSLLDLTLRNRLINFSDRNAIALSVPDGQLARLEDLVNEPKTIHLLAKDALDAVHAARGLTSGWDLPPDHRSDLLASRGQIFTDVGQEHYATRMRNLAYKARTITEESGANNLYLALGSLVWSHDDRALRSPLILVPVQLRPASRGGVYRVTLDESGSSVPNFCLLEKLRQDHGLEIPDLAEPELDGTGIDLDAALHAVRLAINQAGLPYRVEETAHLAILQFAKFRLWKDLDEHWQTFTENALVRHLIETPTEPFGSEGDEAGAEIDLDELVAGCPVPADASQLAAVADAVRGETFVLEGPPGTGKSQTITNLLTRAMVEGRRVLFVAEKRAALDVVRRRLDSVGMGSFSLDLHDKGSKPAVVRSQIKAALDAQIEIDAQGIAVEQERLRAARGTLGRYAQAVHQPNPAGLSFYSAHTSQLALGDVERPLEVPRPFAAAPDGEKAIRTIRRQLQDLPDTADFVRPRPQHPWGFIGQTDPDRTDLDALRQSVRAVDQALAQITVDHGLAEVLARITSPGELAALTAIIGNPQGQLWVLDEVHNPFWQRAADDARAHTEAFAASTHPGMESALPPVINLPLDSLHQQAQTAAASGFFGRKKRLRAVLDQLQPALRPGVTIAPKDVPTLTGQLLQTQQAAQTLRRQVAQIAGVIIGPEWNPLTTAAPQQLSGQLDWLRWSSTVVAPNTTSPAGEAMRSFLAREGQLSAPEAGQLAGLVTALQELQRTAGSTDDHLRSWSQDLGLIKTWQAGHSERDLDDPALLEVRRWIAFVAALEPLREHGLIQARADLLQGTVRADDAVQAFDLGLATASLTERATTTGLTGFDPGVHEKTIARFTQSASTLRTQMARALPHAVLAARPFNSGNESGRVGALRRELNKQRRGLPVRRLIAEYGDLITQVMPCVLVSPDSLSRFFPPRDGLFDVVVFDEASQIRVADSIGALGRARSVVVVGDSKQMPPTSFGEASLDLGDDDAGVLDELVVEDEESILSECVQARVPQKWLSWHYRSQDESLIAFSNALYYEDRLSSFPSPRLSEIGSGPDDVGVSLVRVPGEFQRTRGRWYRTNLVEAEAIVAEVHARFDGSPDVLPSIGIVTFNIQQRTLIESLLRDGGDDRIVEALDDADDGLFVKNLENVQGDERDVIFFSTAFSVDQHGKLPLNFGPLNREGGERRLNVAVTRARRQVIVFSSFDPQQLRAEETTSRGIKDLRAYLDMAASGPAVLDSLITRQRPPSLPDRHREQVAEALREHGLGVTTNVGLSEFKIDIALYGGAIGASADSDADLDDRIDADADGSNRPLVAVLLDGPGWAARRTVGDRDGLPVEVLRTMMRWPAVERVWLPSWLRDPAPIIQRLAQSVATAAADSAAELPVLPDGELAQGPGEAAAADSAAALPGLPDAEPGAAASFGESSEGPATLKSSLPPDQASLDDPAGLADRASHPDPIAPSVRDDNVDDRTPSAEGDEHTFHPWQPATIQSRSTLDSLPGPNATRKVRAVVDEIIAQEGPLHAERLARLTATAFDLTRLTEARAQTILQVVPRERWDRFGEPFIWPDDLDRPRWTAYRRQESASERPLDHIHPQEIGNAMAQLVRDAAGMNDQELLRSANAAFGGTRLTSTVRGRLESVLSHCLESGRLSRTPEGMVQVPAAVQQM